MPRKAAPLGHAGPPYVLNKMGETRCVADSSAASVGPGSRLRVCAGTLSLVQGETVLHEFPMARPANDLPAESGTPSARFCPSPSARRSGLARLDEDNLSPPSRSNCSVARAAASGPAVPVSLPGCACQPVTREDHLRLWAESPAAIRCFSSSASPYRTIGCRVPTSVLLSSAPPSVSFGAALHPSDRWSHHLLS
jgi:hypothetical protein